MRALPDGLIADQVVHKTAAVVAGFPALVDAGVTEAAASRGAAKGVPRGNDAGHLMSALRTYSELMATPGVLAEQYGHLAEELEVLINRSAALLGRSTAARREATPTNKALEATVLPSAVLDSLGLLSKIAGRAVTFSCSPSAYLPVAVSRSAFERILVNLVKNATETLPAGGAVAVTLVGMRQAGLDVEVVLTVQGRGTGSGERSAGGRRGEVRDPRKGVGFQAVRELAESSGAQVEVESELEARTSVSVRWRVVAPGRERRAGMAAERLTALAGLPGSVSKRLLVGGEAC